MHTILHCSHFTGEKRLKIKEIPINGDLISYNAYAYKEYHAGIRIKMSSVCTDTSQISSR